MCARACNNFIPKIFQYHQYLLLSPRESFEIVRKVLSKHAGNVVLQIWNRKKLFLENVHIDVCAYLCVYVCVCVFFFRRGLLGISFFGTPAAVTHLPKWQYHRSVLM